MIAIGLFAVIEITYLLVANPGFMARTNILDYRIGGSENIQRLFTFDKLERLSHSSPTIVQVGDSSGLHAVIPAVVESLLPGNRYLNMNVATTLGYRGYLLVADQVLKRNPTVKYLVLYTSMLCGFPRPSLWDGDPTSPYGTETQGLLWLDFHRDLNSPLGRLTAVPSLGAREAVSRYVWNLGGAIQPLDTPRSSNFAYRILARTVTQSQGWLRETDNTTDLPGNIFGTLDANIGNPRVRAVYDRFGCAEIVEDAWHPATLSRKNYVELVLDEYKKVAQRYGVKLIVMANPIPEGMQARRNMALIVGALSDFQKKNPDTVVFSEMDYWPVNKFSVFSHVETPYAVESSLRVARKLQGVVATTGTVAPPLETRPEVQEIQAADDFSHYGLRPVSLLPAPARRITWAGRREFLLHVFVIPNRAHSFQVFYPRDIPDSVRDTATVSVFGSRLTDATVCDAPADRSCRQYPIPSSLTGKYNGFVEVLFSSRGLVDWPERQATDATDPELFQVTGFRLIAN